MDDASMRALMSGQRRGVAAAALRAALWLASKLYAAVVRIRLALYSLGVMRRHRVATASGKHLPIICVGNLTAGGTGKTPMVALVVGELASLGVRAGILSRGYRGAAGEQNDEARVLAELLPDTPHVQNPDRVAGAKQLEAQGVEAIVMDDGFSHLRLRRDLDVLLVDATCPFGYGHLLPRGLLREPLRSLKRAGFAVITRADSPGADVAETTRVLAAHGLASDRIATAAHRATELIQIAGPPSKAASISDLRGQPLAALCGIARPSAFTNTLTSLGAIVVDSETLQDHFGYDPSWLAREWPALLSRFAATGAAAVVVTQKDAVKLRGRVDSVLPLFELRVEMRVDSRGAVALREVLQHALGQPPRR